MISKKQIAREWLYLLGGAVFGLLVAPSLVWFIFSLATEEVVDASEYFSNFYLGILGGRDQTFAWSVALSPYVLFQLVRSVLWAWKAARGA